jgi:oxaloacetate decarboxylase alpha subunit
MTRLTAELSEKAVAKKFKLVGDGVDDVLTYALFGPTALKFLENRGHPAAFEPPPTAEPETPRTVAPIATGIAPGSYAVTVNGRSYVVNVTEGGVISTTEAPGSAAPVVAARAGAPIVAPLAGTVFKVLVAEGDRVEEGDPVVVLEAMKMEIEVFAPAAGTVTGVKAAVGEAISMGETLLLLA